MDRQRARWTVTFSEGGVMYANHGGVPPADAVAERVRREEEEEMTGYSPQDLAQDWEFKILCSHTGSFRNPEKLRAILDEEKRGGWVLVEKFDNQRIRLKRPAGMKVVEEDLAHPYDPYRTEVGTSSGAIVALVFGLFVTFAGFLWMLARR